MAYPPCVQEFCLPAAFEVTDCSQNNATCLCGDAVFNANMTTCITESCTVREQLAAQKVSMASCNIESDTHDLAPVLAPLLTTLLCIAGIAVAMRVVARFHQRAALWWDDLCDVIGMAMCTGYVVLQYRQLSLGGGDDLWSVDQDNISDYLVNTYASVLLYITGRSIIRYSIIFFYMRIFQIQRAKWLLYATSAVNTVYMLSCFFAIVFQCSPVESFWLRWDGRYANGANGGNSCISLKSVIWVCAAVAFAIDLWLIAFPIPFIVRLKLSWHKKAMTSVMFAIGICVLIISIVRFTTIDKFTTSLNFTKDSVTIALLSGLELEIGIICACLPSIQVLFKPFFSRVKGLTHHGATSKGGSYTIREEGNDNLQPTASPSGGSLGGIRLTTTIRQDMPSESETYLPLQDMQPSMNDYDMTNPKGMVKAQAWA